MINVINGVFILSVISTLVRSISARTTSSFHSCCPAVLEVYYVSYPLIDQPSPSPTSPRIMHIFNNVDIVFVIMKQEYIDIQCTYIICVDSAHVESNHRNGPMLYNILIIYNVYIYIYYTLCVIYNMFQRSICVI